jgi:hypothetical protein
MPFGVFAHDIPAGSSGRSNEPTNREMYLRQGTSLEVRFHFLPLKARAIAFELFPLSPAPSGEREEADATSVGRG